MKKIGKNLILFAFLALTVHLQLSQNSFAAYETVRAKTVKNVNIPDNEADKQEYIPTYNDPDIPNFSEENSVSTKIEKGARNLFEKFKRRKSEIEEENAYDADGEISDNIDEQKTLSPKKGENEVVDDKNKFQINADKITYNDNEAKVYAKGNVEIIAKAQNITLKADVAVLDKTDQTLKLYDNVKILKNGTEMVGEYMLVDLNEQNILMDNPTFQAYSFVIKAQEGYLIANDIQMINGNLKSNKDMDVVFETRGFQKIANMNYGYLDTLISTQPSVSGGKKKPQNYKIDAKEIVVTSYKDHDSIVLKGSNIYYNKHKIINNSDVEIISDKTHQIAETNSFEFGSLRGFGVYAGYGFVSKLPKGHTFKFTPVLTHGSGNLGIGALGRYRSQNGMLEAGYNSSSTDLVARGKYNFGKGFSLRYGRHAYMPDGFYGSRRAGYGAQLQYLKSYRADAVKARFSHSATAGIFSDYTTHKQEKSAYATTRFRYMAELNKIFLTYQNKEQDLRIIFSGTAQAAATLYGSGQTQGVARIGPFITTKVKRWDSSLGYFFTGIHGDSPFIFDKYRYGKSTIMLNEKLHLNDKIALGYRVSITPLKDNYEEDLLTESRLYAIVGPRDLKLAFSYDFVRDIAHLDFMFLLGTESTKINFEKLITKNIDKREEKRQDFYQKRTPAEDMYDEML